jgi:hypothetical protein
MTDSEQIRELKSTLALAAETLETVTTAFTNEVQFLKSQIHTLELQNIKLQTDRENAHCCTCCGCYGF